MARAKGTTTGKSKNGANLGFEQTLWQAADKLRGNMDAADYKHVVLGLIFLKYISDAFQERYETLKKEPHADPDEDLSEYVDGLLTMVDRRFDFEAGEIWRPSPHPGLI